MPLIDNIDGPNRRIYLSVDSIGVDVVPMDIYTEMRTLRRTDEDLRKYDLFLSGEGKVPKGGGKFTERYVQCLQGTRIVPYDTSHTLVIVSGIITDEGTEGIACFDRTPLSPSTVVDIDYQPPQVEVVELDNSNISDILKLTGYKVTKSGDVITIYEADGVTPWRQYNLSGGGRVQV